MFSGMRLGGMRLHHVGYVVKAIEPVAVRYCERFGYERATPVIHDPGQTALVQFLRLEGDATLLELVAPDGPGSKLAGAAGKRGGLHHLCYSVAGLDETVDRLRETGMLLIAEAKAAVAFAGRRICWLVGEDGVLVELVERRGAGDDCGPGA